MISLFFIGFANTFPRTVVLHTMWRIHVFILYLFSDFANSGIFTVLRGSNSPDDSLATDVFAHDSVCSRESAMSWCSSRKAFESTIATPDCKWSCQCDHSFSTFLVGNGTCVANEVIRSTSCGGITGNATLYNRIVDNYNIEITIYENCVKNSGLYKKNKSNQYI